MQQSVLEKANATEVHSEINRIQGFMGEHKSDCEVIGTGTLVRGNTI